MSIITAKRLKELREQKGMSKSEVAKYLGISRPSYVNYENGKNNPSRTIDKLCTLFNVSADYILGTDIKDSNFERACHFYLKEKYTEDEQDLVHEYRKLPDEFKVLIKSTVQMYLNQVEQNKKQKYNDA